METILVTGANGFIGRALVAELSRRNCSVRSTVRKNTSDENVFETGDIGPETDWSQALEGVECVIHLAARVHVMKDISGNPLEEYRKANTDGTLNLARQAVASGVKRFIYLSTIKVNGDLSLPGKPFKADDTPAPQDSYAVSKYEAEIALLELARHKDMEVVIIRPPLVYGPGVKANFLSMMKWVDKGLPLPLAGVKNKRSLVALENLVNFIGKCITHPEAANQVFLVSDDQDLSTPDLLNSVAKLLRKKSRLIAVPEFLLKFAATLCGKKDLISRLLGSLQVDISQTKDMMDWKPPVSVEQAMQNTVDSYKNI